MFLKCLYLKNSKTLFTIKMKLGVQKEIFLNKNVISQDLKTSRLQLFWIEAGSWFHSWGPEIENARSAVLRSALDCVLGMHSLKELADLRPGRVVLRQS